jgi:hypothetical protein
MTDVRYDILSYGLAIIVGLGNAYSGWGDGATSSHPTPILSIVLPFSCIFLSGLIAALIPSRWVRIILCMISVGTPYYALWFTRGSDTYFIAGLFLVIQIMFIPAWIWMIKSKKKTSHTLAEI